jgi:hypothetical protein
MTLLPIQVLPIASSLTPRGPPRAADPDSSLVSNNPDDKDEPPRDWADRDEAILDIGVRLVENLQVADT